MGAQVNSGRVGFSLDGGVCRKWAAISYGTGAVGCSRSHWPRSRWQVMKKQTLEKNCLCTYHPLIFCSCVWQGVSLPSQVIPNQPSPCLIPSPFPPPIQRTTTLKPHKALQLFSHIIKLSRVILAGGLLYSSGGMALKPPLWFDYWDSCPDQLLHEGLSDVSRAQ